MGTSENNDNVLEANETQKGDSSYQISTAQKMAAACTGGIITSLLMTPLDVVKIRLQSQQRPTDKIINKCFLYCNGLMDHLCPCFSTNGNSNSAYSYWYTKPNNFNGTLDAFVKITRQEGVSSLWSGLSPTLVLALPATVVYFVTYDHLRLTLNAYCSKKGYATQPAWVPLTSGVVARLWAATLVSPLELIRTKMQSKRLSYFEMHEAVRNLVHYHGVKGLWRGLVPTLMRDVPFSGIYWVCYENIKIRLNPRDGYSFFYSFISGSISATIAAVVTNPFDVVKTLYQIDFIGKQIMTEPPDANHQSISTTVQKVYKNHGVSGLFSGLVPRLVKVVPACAIMVASFEYGKNFFLQRNMEAASLRCNNHDRIQTPSRANIG